MSFFKSLGEFLLDFLETIAVASAIFIVLYMFVFQPHVVRGQSMYPTLKTGEHLLTSKLAYRFGQPDYNDIVVFHAPNHENLDYIKRIIALPGDRIKLIDGQFYVNGYPLDESAYLDPAVVTSSQRYLLEGTEVTIPPNHYFVAGDNRVNSSDSRDFGPVPEKNIVGKAWIRYWPPNKIGTIKLSE